MMQHTLGRALVALAAALLPAANLVAAEFTFTIDPARSALTLAGSAFSDMGSPLPLEEQAPGSLTAPYGGSVVVDITATTVAFLGGSPPGSVLAALNGVSETLVGVSSTTVSGMGGTLASFSSDGVTETLTLPLTILYHDFVPTAELDFTLEGAIVATRPVPEPATVGLLLLGALAFRKRRF